VVAPPPANRYSFGVPRFFFHIYDDIVLRDEDGIELADAEVARSAALAGARAIMCDQLAKGRLSLYHRIEVEDESGGQVLTLAFGDAVEIVTRPA
jgi:hypothetical protein